MGVVDKSEIECKTCSVAVMDNLGLIRVDETAISVVKSGKIKNIFLIFQFFINSVIFCI